MGRILENGYEVKTTFWQDFTIADAFGIDAIKDTFKRSFNDFKADYEYITELAIMTNWKCWQHWENNNHTISKLYADMYYEVRGWCLDNLKDDELKYFLEWTD